MRIGFMVSGRVEETRLVQGDELVVRPKAESFWLRRPRPPLPGPLNRIPRNIGCARIWWQKTTPREGGTPLFEWCHALPIRNSADPLLSGEWPEIIEQRYPRALGGPLCRWDEVVAGWTHHLPSDVVYRLIRVDG